MKRFFGGLSRLLKCNPAWHACFDLGEAVYRNEGDATPAFSYALKGSFKITLRQVLAVGTALACLCLIGKRSKQSRKN